MKKVFIDGSAGTTGLRIYERLSERKDIELISLPEELRKDAVARKDALNRCDIAFLCLPDDAARESVSMIENPDVTVIDTSTAHRTDSLWSYGFPELSEAFEKKILSSKRIAVPGCHASGFISLVYPLVEAGILGQNSEISCFSVTGYSGGGKKMIADYESTERCTLLDAPRQYAIAQQHKHLKEMRIITGLEKAPVFCPIVADFYSGMTVTVPLFADMLGKGCGAEDIREIYRAKYCGNIVKYEESVDDAGFISAKAYSGKDSMKITVAGNDERILLISAYDNLGKGASGAAVECMNMVLGVDRTCGLVL